MNHSGFIRLQAVPLDQHVEGRDDKGHARAEIISLPMVLMFEIAGSGEHR